MLVAEGKQLFIARVAILIGATGPLARSAVAIAMTNPVGSFRKEKSLAGPCLVDVRESYMCDIWMGKKWKRNPNPCNQQCRPFPLFPLSKANYGD